MAGNCLTTEERLLHNSLVDGTQHNISAEQRGHHDRQYGEQKRLPQMTAGMHT